MFLNQLLEEYKESKDKDAIMEEFLTALWKNKCVFRKYKKYYTYKVNSNLLGNRQDLIDLFTKYNRVEYTVCKSYYSRTADYIDYIRIHINNMYGYLFDNDVYYKSDYYKLLITPKREYFKAINFIKDGGDVSSININETKSKIEDAFARADIIKRQSINRKHQMKWPQYKKLINTYIKRIFDNYIPVEEYEKEYRWDMKVSVDGWSEDNYIISYICKSLTGYMKNYINKLNGIKKHKRYKECIMCGRLIEDTVSNKKYCPQCAKEIKMEQDRIRMKNIRQSKALNPENH